MRIIKEHIVVFLHARTHKMKQWVFGSSGRALVWISSVVTAVLLLICLGFLLSIQPTCRRPAPPRWQVSLTCIRDVIRFVLQRWEIVSRVIQTLNCCYRLQARMTSRADRLAHQQQREQGIGTNKHAVKFSGQDYETLWKECLRRGCLFEDDCFPAGSKSLGFEELGPYSPKTRGVIWKRPKVNTHIPITAWV